MRLVMFLVIIFFIFCFNNSLALKCYTCSIGENDVDTTCVTDPAKAAGSAITNCDKKYCTIYRQELLDPIGKVVSFLRNCEDTPKYMNQFIDDGTFRHYYQACKQDLCNGGNGKDDTNKDEGYLGDKSTIYCPGTGKVA